jgi:hypothetical protein
MKVAHTPVEEEIESAIKAARLRLEHEPTRQNAAALMAAVERRTPAMKQRMEADRMRRIAEGG